MSKTDTKPDNKLANREVSNNNLKPGRPKGAKNKTTLVKEAIKEGMEETLLQYGLKVIQATAQAAVGKQAFDKDGSPVFDEHGNPLWIDGDNQCKKMLLDRMVPIAEATGSTASGKQEIVINISGMEAKVELMGDDPLDADFEEVESHE